MARWRARRTASFEDLPARLQPREGEARERVAERHQWLEDRGLSVADYLGARRARSPGARRRPPSRRKLMTAEQLAEFDRQREEKEPWRW